MHALLHPIAFLCSLIKVTRLDSSIRNARVYWGFAGVIAISICVANGSGRNCPVRRQSLRYSRSPSHVGQEFAYFFRLIDSLRLLAGNICEPVCKGSFKHAAKKILRIVSTRETLIRKSSSSEINYARCLFTVNPCHCWRDPRCTAVVKFSRYYTRWKTPYIHSTVCTRCLYHIKNTYCVSIEQEW